MGQVKEGQEQLNKGDEELGKIKDDITVDPQIVKISPLEWSREHRIIDGESYDIYPGRGYLFNLFDHFLREQRKKKVVIQKAAQVGASEAAINISFWFLEYCGDVMYVLPTSGDSSDFSAGRINPAIEESPELDSFFTDTDNIGHKRAGVRNYYIRGSQSRSKLKSVPIDLVIFDEVDECVQENLPLALDRLDASEFKWEMWISTPRFPDHGINKEWKNSDQRKWFITCQECGTEQTLEFEYNILDGEYVCRRCGERIPDYVRTEEGRWKQTNPDADCPGFHVNQLMSPTVTARELQEQYEDAEGNASKMQDFYNSKLGLPYAVEGDKIAVEDVTNLIKRYRVRPNQDRERTMGVDVGTYLHYVISEYDDDSMPDNADKKVVKAGKVVDFEDLDRLIENWNIYTCVIDSKPETRKAEELSSRINKRDDIPCNVFLCEYADNYRQKFMLDRDRKWIKVDRTFSLDESFGKIFTSKVIFPSDVPSVFAEHFSSLVRILEEKRTTQELIARYKNSGPDHYAHAYNYDVIAKKIHDQYSGRPKPFAFTG